MYMSASNVKLSFSVFSSLGITPFIIAVQLTPLSFVGDDVVVSLLLVEWAVVSSPSVGRRLAIALGGALLGCGLLLRTGMPMGMALVGKLLVIAVGLLLGMELTMEGAKLGVSLLIGMLRGVLDVLGLLVGSSDGLVLGCSLTS